MASTGSFLQAEMWRDPAPRWVFHVDMDAFFASVEQLDRPSLKGLPVIVANSPLPVETLREMAARSAQLKHRPDLIKGIRGVVASASYEARASGVRSAMPLARALSLCPHAEVLPGNFDRYCEVARDLQAIWSSYSPLIEPVSIDEAYIDMTGVELSGGPIESIARQLKAQIKAETGLTASIGVASSKLVAKIASDLEKPDGLVVVRRGDEARTLGPLSVRALPGVGPRTAEAMATLSISTIHDLATTSIEALTMLFGAEQAASLLRRAAGIDNSPVELPGDAKSISRETTLADDTADLPVLKSKLRVLSDHVAWTLRRDQLVARCVYIKLRLLPAKRTWQPDGEGFGKLITRRCTLPVHTDDAAVIAEVGARLLDAAAQSTGLAAGKEVVRLLGIGTSSLAHPPELVDRSPDSAREIRPSSRRAKELNLGEEVTGGGRERDRKLNASIDTIRAKYGFKSITLGSGSGDSEADNAHD